VSYQDLGPRTQLGVSDVTAQVNPFLLGTGWDVIFDPTVWASNLTTIEIYQISLDGPVGSSVWMLRNGKPWNLVLQGWQNYNDPTQPIPLGQTDTVQFCWSFAFTSPPYTGSGGSNVRPTVTVWLRHEIPAPGL
jgi:hypothetical protein